MPINYSSTISDFFRLRRSTIGFNALGIEVEAESATPNYDTSMLESNWNVHNDGSLLNGIELTSNPFELSDRHTSLNRYKALRSFFDKNKCTVSERASTHVHVNCRQRTLMNVINTAVAWWLLENIFLEYSGPDRTSNHFCLGISDSMFMAELMARKIKEGTDIFPSQEFKYSCLNFGRLRDLGTLEIRCMGSLVSSRKVFEWAKTLTHFFEGVEGRWKNPAELIWDFSNDPVSFSKSLLSDYVLKYFEDEALFKLSTRNLNLVLPFVQIDWNNLGKYEKEKSMMDDFGMPVFGDEPDWDFNEEEIVNARTEDLEV